jgi:hypothetical protein
MPRVNQTVPEQRAWTRNPGIQEPDPTNRGGGILRDSFALLGEKRQSSPAFTG